VKLNTATRGTQLQAVSAKEVATALQGVGADFPFYGLLAILAEMSDNIAQGRDQYATIGATKARDALVVTIKDNGVGTPVYGASLGDLSTKLEGLL